MPWVNCDGGMVEGIAGRDAQAIHRGVQVRQAGRGRLGYRYRLPAATTLRLWHDLGMDSGLRRNDTVGKRVVHARRCDLQE